MAGIAVLASGSGSNFEALALALRSPGTQDEPVGGSKPPEAAHEVRVLLCDKPGAFALERAKRLGVPSRLISYKGKPREEAEAELAEAIEASGASLVVLAGFMRILGPGFVGRFAGRIVNIHPSLLPAYPGAHAIERAFEAGERVLGVTVHYVDEGMDTGPILAQVQVPRRSTLEETEAAIHEAEHALYPSLVKSLLSRENVTND